MVAQIQEKVFSSLQISKDQFLEQMGMLLIKQQVSEYTMEVEYFEKKYCKAFPEFDLGFQTQPATDEMENDWMSWKFAVESQKYWQDLLLQTQP